MIDWNMFGAGIALIIFSVLLYSFSGVLSLFKIKAKIPWIIPFTLFIISILILLESVGIVTDLNTLLLTSISTSNIPELIFGLTIFIIAIYTPLLERLKVNISGWTRLFILIFGLLLILDAIRILPTFYYIAGIIETSLIVISTYIQQYPWISGLIILGLIIYATLMWYYLSRRSGGVRT